MAFYGLYLLLTGSFGKGAMLVVLGYILQYVGHKAQGNEVGEVTLIRNIWKRLSRSRISTEDGR
jgi:uncharacterized membrane protein YGL010W